MSKYLLEITNLLNTDKMISFKCIKEEVLLHKVAGSHLIEVQALSISLSDISNKMSLGSISSVMKTRKSLSSPNLIILNSLSSQRGTFISSPVVVVSID